MEKANMIGIILITLLMLLFFYALIQATTKEEIGTERVKCIDKYGAEFEDEWCIKPIYCYKFSFEKKNKCKNVGGGE